MKQNCFSALHGSLAAVRHQGAGTKRDCPGSLKGQRGVVGAGLVVGLLMAAVVVGVLGTTALTISRSSSQVQTSIATSQLAQQTVYAVAQQVNISTGMTNAVPASGSTPHPQGATFGFLVPAGIGGVQRDSAGTQFAYCPYDNKNATPATGFVKGSTPLNGATPVFALIGAGPDRIFQTNCEAARTTSAAAAGSDDLVRVMNGQQIVQGAGGTKYFGDPVQNVSDLAPITSASPGELRVVMSTGQVYVRTSTAWQAVSGGGGQAHTKLGYDLTVNSAPKAVFRDKFLVSGTPEIAVSANNIPWVYKNVDEAEQSLPYWIQEITTFFKNLENDTHYDSLIGLIPQRFGMPSGSWAVQPGNTDMDNDAKTGSAFYGTEFFELIVGRNPAGTEIYFFRFAVLNYYWDQNNPDFLYPFRMVYQTSRVPPSNFASVGVSAMGSAKPACGVRVGNSHIVGSGGFPLMFEPITLEISR